MKQVEIPITPAVESKNYWKEHICKTVKKERRVLVFMRQGVAEGFFVGVCSSCGERIIETTPPTKGE